MIAAVCLLVLPGMAFGLLLSILPRTLQDSRIVIHIFLMRKLRDGGKGMLRAEVIVTGEGRGSLKTYKMQREKKV